AAFDFWRKLEPVRRAAARRALHRITETKGVSTNLFEIAQRLVEG
ncbi:MAG: aminopeptidase N C-terminal domain-containing protein, partial [Parvularculaceae bacterium]|nr:aminopeptidase N C-terminal domain-containing protein [Parvularculaceae bacterium]